MAIDGTLYETLMEQANAADAKVKEAQVQRSAIVAVLRGFDKAGSLSAPQRETFRAKFPLHERKRKPKPAARAA